LIFSSSPLSFAFPSVTSFIIPCAILAKIAFYWLILSDTNIVGWTFCLPCVFLFSTCPYRMT
jgi:hypothetical protein